MMICKKLFVRLLKFSFTNLKFQDGLSGKMPAALNIPTGSMGPGDKDVMSQLNVSHPLQASELKVKF
jgi:hypothetical protein